MKAGEKLILFDKTRLAVSSADCYAMEINGTLITPDNAAELLRRCRLATAAAEFFERAMHGVEPPEPDSSIPNPF